MTSRLERALRYAAEGHREQSRKGSGVPYVTHVFAVAWILDRAGFDEDVAIAGLLHDLVEDTAATLEEIRGRFGERVAGLVEWCSEIKLDGEGRKRPWIDRKRDHLAALTSAPLEVKAIILADKLHNLISIRLDMEEGRPVWDQFNAGRDQVLWYYRESIATCEAGDPRVGGLAAESRAVLEDLGEGDSPTS